MRRDVCYYFPVPVDQLYNAYLQVATGHRFKRDCNQEPYHTLGFGLKFSMKYNMNGGGCTLRFMPYENGSAVNLRFTIAQLAAARYEKYAQDLTDGVNSLLGVWGRKTSIDVELFLKPENQIGHSMQPLATPTAQSNQNTPQYEQAPMNNTNPQNSNTCPNCGRAFNDGDRFCMGCGMSLLPQNKVCSNCGAQLPLDAVFCSVCGNRL